MQQATTNIRSDFITETWTVSQNSPYSGCDASNALHKFCRRPPNNHSPTHSQSMFVFQSDLLAEWVKLSATCSSGFVELQMLLESWISVDTMTVIFILTIINFTSLYSPYLNGYANFYELFWLFFAFVVSYTVNSSLQSEQISNPIAACSCLKSMREKQKKSFRAIHTNTKKFLYSSQVQRLMCNLTVIWATSRMYYSAAMHW